MIRLFIRQHRIAVFLFLFATTFISKVWSQDDKNTASEEFVRYIEKIYGQDDLIYQGRLYKNAMPMASGNPYFISPDWQNASIYVRERTYSNVPVLYDIYAGKLIVQADYKDFMKVPIDISGEVIDSFKIDNHLFINMRSGTENNKDTYYEKVFSGNRIYLLHYTKYVVDNHYASNSNGSYSETKKNLYIVKNGNWTRCADKSAFLHYFNAEKKSLRKYIRRQHIQYKNAGMQELQKLCEFADKQLNE